MRVPKERLSTHRNELAAIAIVLNLDFDNVEPAELERLRKLDLAWFVEVQSISKRPADAEKAKAAQSKAKGLLMPILAPAGDITAEEASDRIEKLITAINQHAPKIELELASTDREWIFAEDEEGNVTDAGLVLRENGDNEYYLDHLHSPKRLDLLGYYWAVGRKRSGVTGIPIEWGEDIYHVIRQALENQTFTRLRVCPVCTKFFFADDNREKFCSDEHRNEFNNKARLTGTYYQERRKKARKQHIATARRLLREGRSPKEIARETKLSLRVLKRERIIQ
jgi:hypothetical protein